MPSSKAPNMSDPSTTWFSYYTKLRFFTRIRRFLKLNPPRKQLKPSPLQLDTPRNTDTTRDKDLKEDMGIERPDRQDEWMVLQKAVKRLHFGSWQEKQEAAEEITMLAKQDLKTRKLMAELGVVQPLVAMLGSENVERRRLAVEALIQLADGTFTNKAVMVEAGILSKLPESGDSMDEPTKQKYAELLLSVSSLANNGFPLTSSRIIAFAVCILESSSSSIETINLCLATLHNLSLVLDNAATMATPGVITTLLRLSSSIEASEKALSTLANLVVTLTGKKALENNPMVPECLIETLAWEENAKCQELSAYILMILAHQSSVQRDKMEKAGIVPVLLEVALLGSALAQKRALKLLQWFKNERQVKMGNHSGPQVGRIIIVSPVISQKEVDEGKKLMKSIVKQSLYKNLEKITRRANGSADSSGLKALAATSSSKSLPY